MIAIFIHSGIHFCSTDDPSKQNTEYQLACMYKVLLFADVNAPLLGFQADGRDAPEIPDMKNPCSWTGIECTPDDIVIKIRWTRMTAKAFDIDWFPPTTEVVNLNDLRLVNETLNTQRFPISARLYGATGCGLQGSVELRTLPSHLEILSLEDNHFSGTVFLTDLPDTLRGISFTSNLIEVVYVKNKSLPERFDTASFVNRHFKQKVKLICVDGKKVDPRVTTKKAYRPSHEFDSWSASSSSYTTDDSFSLEEIIQPVKVYK
mmetsp:Transcript_7925/g.11970  ORF Transcript_7925/g.11970 Transcript_7925/m.11970 type:complete len:262 (-) Transcript_7925:6-791(-)